MHDSHTHRTLYRSVRVLLWVSREQRRRRQPRLRTRSFTVHTAARLPRSRRDPPAAPPASVVLLVREDDLVVARLVRVRVRVGVRVRVRVRVRVGVRVRSGEG